MSFNGSDWFSRSAHQIPNFNSIFSTNTNPLHFWIESNSKNLSITHEIINDELKFKDLSLGMSNDYLLAINFKSTYIRLGTSIFGDRG